MAVFSVSMSVDVAAPGDFPEQVRRSGRDQRGRPDARVENLTEYDTSLADLPAATPQDFSMISFEGVTGKLRWS
jgi:hypothetical protein